MGDDSYVHTRGSDEPPFSLVFLFLMPNVERGTS